MLLKAKNHVKTRGRSALSVVLSLLIVCSTLFLGSVATLEASAATNFSGLTIYMDTTDVYSYWNSDSFTVVAWSLNGTNKAQCVTWDTNTICHFTFPANSGNWFTLLRWNPAQLSPANYQAPNDIPNDAWSPGSGDTAKCWNRAANNNASGNILSTNMNGDINKLYIKSTSCSDKPACKKASWAGDAPEKTDWDLTGRTPVDVTAKNGFKDNTSLVPVPAVFYDYYSDYEVTNGWRSLVNDSNGSELYGKYVSRSYSNSFPYTVLNNYINNQVTSTWQLPLYFGNFFTVHSLSYSTEPQWVCFGGYDEATFNKGNMSKVKLKSFSSQANNSMFMKISGDDDWAKGVTTEQIDDNGETVGFSDASRSYLGLANSNLVNGQLTMGTGEIAAPYFSDDIVNAGIAAKVTTEFPMRVEEHTANSFYDQVHDTYTNTGSYNTYVFDSYNGKDNVYFENYGSNNFTIKYAQDSHQVKDALFGFGGSEDNYGFFPFDDTGDDNNNNAYDFGFGMRLDIPFNIGSNGYIENSRVPMTFRFSGDDDVWVFIDGKLALDLGGDHKQARGWIDFAEKKAYISSGIYKPGLAAANSSNVYGNPTVTTSAYDLTWQKDTGLSTGSVDYFSASLDHIIDYSSADWSDTSTPHTLTVFYMERGMSESNLKLEFTVSPLQNELTVDKEISTNGVNNALKDEVKTQAANDTFNYKVKVGTGAVSADPGSVTYSDSWTNSYDGSGATPVYTDLNDENAASYNSTTGITGIKDGKGFKFSKQIADDGTKFVNVTETIPETGNLYTYTTPHMSVKDVSANSYTLADTEASDVKFKFKTASTQTGAITKFYVHNTNYIKTRDLAIEKILAGDTSTEFSFKVEVKVPGASSYVTLSENYSVTSGNTGSAITGIPVGSTVKITELNLVGTGYDTPTFAFGSTTITTNPAEFTLTDGDDTAIIACTNNPVVVDVEPIKLSLEGTKNLDGELSGQIFDFTVHRAFPCTDANKITTAANATTGSDKGKFSFTDFEEITKDWYDNHADHKAVYYVKETALGAASPYTSDESVYQVTYTISFDSTSNTLSASAPVIKKAASNTAGAAWENAAGVVFNNTTKPGQVVVTKKGSDEALLEGVNIALVEAVQDGSSWKAKDGAVPRVQTTNSSGIATFNNVASGDYIVYETKSIDGYELYGKVEHVEVAANGAATVTIIDPKSTKLPETGGIGTALFITLGIIFIGAAVILLKPSKKDVKKTKEKEV